MSLFVIYHIVDTYSVIYHVTKQEKTNNGCMCMSSDIYILREEGINNLTLRLRASARAWPSLFSFTGPRWTLALDNLSVMISALALLLPTPATRLPGYTCRYIRKIIRVIRVIRVIRTQQCCYSHLSMCIHLK